MRRLSLFAILAAAVCAAPARPAFADNWERDAWRENRRLEAEVVLASTPKPYFVLDLERRSITLKTRAMVLFEVPVLEYGVWGPRLAIGPTAVERRDALARPEVRPSEEKSQETLEEQILELSDMPTRYRLRLAGEVDVAVQSLAEGRWQRWRQRAEIWRWRLTRPLVTLRQRRQRHETASVYIVLMPADAQRLYWSLFEGLDGILVPP